ncbi:MAG: hypothetical protein WB626_10080 [Bacteroidota bacterium]
MSEPVRLPEREEEMLDFLKQRYPLYHLSNIFLRDVQFGIRIWARERGAGLDYGASEQLALAFLGRLEQRGIALRLDDQTWVLRHEPFRKPRMVKEAPARPHPAGSGAAPAGAGAGPKPAGHPGSPPAGAA